MKYSPKVLGSDCVDDLLFDLFVDCGPFVVFALVGFVLAYHFSYLILCCAVFDGWMNVGALGRCECFVSGDGEVGRCWVDDSQVSVLAAAQSCCDFCCICSKFLSEGVESLVGRHAVDFSDGGEIFDDVGQC